MKPESCPARVTWFFGLSGAGKSTLARSLADRWISEGRRVTLLDGDALRQGLCRDLGFTEADRTENIRRAAEVARLFVEAGIWVVAAFITPGAALRELACGIVGAERFDSVFVRCPLTVCAERDPKGHYREAMSGRRPMFTGVDAAFEEPAEGSCLHVDTATAGVQECVDQIDRVLPQRAKWTLACDPG